MTGPGGLTFTNSYKRLLRDALCETRRLVHESSVLGEADVDIVTGDVLDGLDRDWATVAAGRSYGQIRNLMRVRIRREVADVAGRRRRYHDKVDPTWRDNSTRQGSNDLEDDYAERDRHERLRDFIEKLSEPTRSVLLCDEEGIRRYGITPENVRQIRHRWIKKMQRAIASNAEGYGWLA